LGRQSNLSYIGGNVKVTCPSDKHWLVDTSLTMPVTLKLEYKKKTIINHDPILIGKEIKVDEKTLLLVIVINQFSVTMFMLNGRFKVKYVKYR